MEQDGEEPLIIANDSRVDNDGQGGDEVAVYTLTKVYTLRIKKYLTEGRIQ